MQQGESFPLVCLTGGWGMDPPEDLLVGFPLGFLKPADIPRLPGQWHSGKPERDPGEGAGGWGLGHSSTWVTFEPFIIIEKQRHGEWAHGKSLQHCKTTFLGLALGAVGLQSLTKADTISLSDLQLQQDQLGSCVPLPGGGARSLLKSLSCIHIFLNITFFQSTSKNKKELTLVSFSAMILITPPIFCTRLVFP